MTFDGESGETIAYNYLGLPRKITSTGGTLAKYSYLASGSKTEAEDGSGAGLVYRGSLIYKKASNGTLTFDGASIPEGRLLSGATRLYVTDHLGSVKAVVNGNNGNLYEVNNYTVYGKQSANSSASSYLSTAPTGEKFRQHFTGKEDQAPDFAVPFTDFGARHYSPALRRWLVPNPLSEKYYGISPYAYCAGDPVNLVDPDGREGVKYVDENGNLVVESNVVVLLKKERQIEGGMSRLRTWFLRWHNKAIQRRNEYRLNQIKTALDSEFGEIQDSDGNTVKFVFNIIPIEEPKRKDLSYNDIIDIAIENGISAETPYKYDRSRGVAVASVFTNQSSSGIGDTKGKIMISLSSYAPEAIAHEEGHALGLSHPKEGGRNGLMHYPPERITPLEVSLIVQKAYEKK